MLFIPAFDLTNPAYPDGLAQLDKEPARTAGFLRIEQIFKPLGFATRIVDSHARERERQRETERERV